MEKTLHYNYRMIDGYNAKVTVILAKRGLGKTFGRVIRGVKRFKDKGKRFIYVVETEDMVNELSQNKGEKFFSKIIEYLKTNNSKTHQKLLDFIQGGTEVTEGDIFNKIKGGTIIIGNQTAGYIVSISGFAKLKRNNFVNVSEIIIDEFIPETIDIRSLKMTYKINSLIQSIARTQNDIKIYMLGNTIRLNDNVLISLGLKNLKIGEIRKIYDKYGLFLVCHYVDNRDYEDFKKLADSSVAGRFAKLTGVDNLEENTFSDEMDNNLKIPTNAKSSHLLICLVGEAGSVRINVTKDYKEYYVLEDYGDNMKKRFCVDPKMQNDVVHFNLAYKDWLITLYSQGKLKFENSYVYSIFKLILNLKN